MKIGITGAGGYIGCRLVQKLTENTSYEIIACDNGHSQQMKRVNDVDILYGDIQNLEQMEELFSDMDALIHLAAISGLDESEEDPNTAFEVNVVGTENISKVCNKNQIPLLFASSILILLAFAILNSLPFYFPIFQYLENI